MTQAVATFQKAWHKFTQPVLSIGSILLISSALFSTPSHAETEPSFTAQQQQEFQIWLQDFSKRAMAEGISKATLDKAFTNIQLSNKILQMDRKQPEFTRTFFEYLSRAVSKTRIENGRENHVQNMKLLKAVEDRYGVPSAYLVAFWGMETNYGGYTGYDPIIQSLATLAFDPRRSEFFSKELIAALTILDRGDVSLSDMQGSWAGAMGQVQFMPTNYLRYAVDGDGDGKVNLWTSTADALFSAGNFLNQLGWQRGQEWGLEVKLPKGFDLSLADNKTKRSINEWQELNIKTTENQTLRNAINPAIQDAILVLPSDYRGPTFLVFDNFKVIKRWNNSTNYAIGVGYLADQIRYKAQLTKGQPADDKGLNRNQVIEIQSLLNELGFSVGKADGIAGGMTRSGLRAFQKSISIPADGYPSVRMLNYLRSALKQSNNDS
ncbi:lytic murein transglycosylase [Thiomicrorhabdus sp. 6S2-11]|uniref:Lytic murein transglycosylase n=1 Tax=Thiomicrorhabdus marina TaxID=2818442 RepID=A0ABS3Q3T6_9GAMM|nr:lytic murein transglycosylase [Thiomicrorhabdus marina]MBO1926984.1 lytic murein transglycosylase [Thiomicrorhabdus marina]